MKALSCLIAILCLLAAMPADASRSAKPQCGCTEADIASRAKGADKIYTATATEIRIPEDMVEAGRDDPPAIVTFKVTEGFKDAAKGDTETLHTSLTRVTCTGHAFVEGADYLVFAYRRRAENYEYWSLYDFKTGTHDTGGLCGGTKSQEGADADLTVLREMKASNAAALIAAPPKTQP